MLFQVADGIPGQPLQIEVYSVTPGNSSIITKVIMASLPQTDPLGSQFLPFKLKTWQNEGNLTLDDLRPWTEYSLALYVDDLSPHHRDLAFCPTSSCRTMEGGKKLVYK